MIQRVHGSTEIRAPVEKVFSYLEDPGNEPEWKESIVDFNNITGAGPGAHYACSWKMAGIRLHGQTTRKEDVLNRRIVDETNGDCAFTWTYMLDPHGNSTAEDPDLTYTIQGKVRRRLRK